MTALRDLVRPICRVATLLASAAVANAQQVDDLRQQLEQLKQEYQHKIQEMEKRIGDLETQKSSPAVAVIDKNALAEEVKNDVKGLISSQPGALQGSCPANQPMTSCRRRIPKSKNWRSRQKHLNSTATSDPVTG